MNLFIHNLKVAWCNFMKYKLQTLISVLSIAVGIVTLAFTYSALERYRLPDIFSQPYSDRAYLVYFKPANDETKAQMEETMKSYPSLQDGDNVKINIDIIRALKGSGGLRNAEKIVVPNVLTFTIDSEFLLTDSSLKKGNIIGNIMDPIYPEYAGIQSAITGKKIGKLKEGEAILSEDLAKKIFGDKNPVGAVQNLTCDWQPIPITIKDVFKATPILEFHLKNDQFYYCITDSIEDAYPPYYMFTTWIDVVMKEGSDEKDLHAEIASRVSGLGYEPVLVKMADNPTFKKVIPLKWLLYGLGSLILLAAVIGFLRIETQLFRIRSREFALRLANGAKSIQVYETIMIEISIVIFLSLSIAMILGYSLQDFLDSGGSVLMNQVGFYITGLVPISLFVGIALLFLCAAIAWFTLQHISDEREGLARDMRKNRNHLFRNAMLCMQIIISMVFLNGAFIIIDEGELVMESNNVPANDKTMREFLYVEPSYSSNPDRLISETRCSKHLERMIMYDKSYTMLTELVEDPDICAKIDGGDFCSYYSITDTTTLSTLGIDVRWNGAEIDRNECFLLSENLSKKFKELGINGFSTLTIKYLGLTLPIGGTVGAMPYDGEGGNYLIAISAFWEKEPDSYILTAKDGRYLDLERDIEKTIQRLEPENINQIVFNFRERINMFPGIVESVHRAGLVLGIVSLVICGMGIFSTVALDTRARRKEVAIRKANGAKKGDIYRMFVKIYGVLILISLIISVPVSVLLCRWLQDYIILYAQVNSHLSPVTPIILGCGIVIFLIFVIVNWQIHRVIHIDPAKIIAKE